MHLNGTAKKTRDSSCDVILGASIAPSNACKIATFDQEQLKFWNLEHLHVNFKISEKQISLHSHFKSTCKFDNNLTPPVNSLGGNYFLQKYKPSIGI